MNGARDLWRRSPFFHGKIRIGQENGITSGISRAFSPLFVGARRPPVPLSAAVPENHMAGFMQGVGEKQQKRIFAPNLQQ